MSIGKDLPGRLRKDRSAADRLGKDGVLAELAERALGAELDEHLSEERADPAPEGPSQPSNRRNGSSQKTVATDSGKLGLVIPCDRNGSLIRG